MIRRTGVYTSLLIALMTGTVALAGLPGEVLAASTSTAPQAGRNIRQPVKHRSADLRTAHSPGLPGLTLGLSGAVDDLSDGSAASVSAWDARARFEKAQQVRIEVQWALIAPQVRAAGFNASSPNSPGYNWVQLDREVTAVASAGFQPLIDIYNAPRWAEGADAPSSAPTGTWKPSPTQYGQFATAIATRYDGTTPGLNGAVLPRVKYWEPWNEPNLSEYLTPQWVVQNGVQVPTSPDIYRSLDTALYSSVKSVSSSNFVIAAGTAPYGDPPGGSRMQPVTFDQYLLCVNAAGQKANTCAGPTYLDALDDHPYVSGLCCHPPTWHAANANDTAVADMGKITRVLADARTAQTVLPAGAKQIWATELGWNTDPPNPNADQASPPAMVGRWATQALYILWSAGVAEVFWLQLGDYPESPDGWAASFTEGLYYIDGTAKPAAAAFAFPFLTNRQSKSKLQAWGRAPRGGWLTVQQHQGGRWTSLFRLRVSTGQVFETSFVFHGAGSFRAVVGGRASPAWSQTP